MKKLINHVSARRPLFLIMQKHPLSLLFVIGSAVHSDGKEAGCGSVAQLISTFLPSYVALCGALITSTGLIVFRN